MKNALAIAGFDPSGWAGLLADSETFKALGLKGYGAAAALTAQNLTTVKGVTAVEPGFLSREIETLLEEFEMDAVKVGMLATAANVRVVGRVLKKGRMKNIVLDPVMRSTGGRMLLSREGVKVLISELLPLSTIVTPNINEATVISGIKIKGMVEMEAAAEKIFSLGPGSVLIKGGHLQGPPVDVLYDGKDFYYFRGRRIKGAKEIFHGTGCVLSSAIASGLAMGRPLKEAVEGAKKYLEKVIMERKDLLKGRGSRRRCGLA
ncbi:MAG: bifunctional hydroxymethylpyrimidine kinase/phosphomethylpyrimidine kinase [Thermodesulfobacteriota bacterium]